MTDVPESVHGTAGDGNEVAGRQFMSFAFKEDFEFAVDDIERFIKLVVTVRRYLWPGGARDEIAGELAVRLF